jgi:hypothetical protein
MAIMGLCSFPQGSKVYIYFLFELEAEIANEDGEMDKLQFSEALKRLKL